MTVMGGIMQPPLGDGRAEDGQEASGKTRSSRSNRRGAHIGQCWATHASSVLHEGEQV